MKQKVCEKIGYFKKAEARQVLRELGYNDAGIYFCTYHKRYHIGHHNKTGKLLDLIDRAMKLTKGEK